MTFSSVQQDINHMTVRTVRAGNEAANNSLKEIKKMTYVITSPCIGEMNTSCVDVCPVDCIYYEPGVDENLFIDPDECIGCGACEPACPVMAIFAKGDVPPDEKEFIELNRLYFQESEPVRQRVRQLNEAAA